MIRASVIGLVLLLWSSCGAPTLETPECRSARPAIREFYSFHVAGEMLLSRDSLKARERFLTPEFGQRLETSAEGVDPFTTGTADVPRAFRDGKCETISPDKTSFELLIFWRSNDRTEQRKIAAEAIKTDTGWKIDRVIY